MPSVYAPTISDAPTASDAQLIRDKLAAARLYVCTDARRERNDFAKFVDAAYTGGVDIIQLRDKNIEAAEELEYFTVLRDAARRHGKLFSANDRVDITSLAGAPVFHAGQGDLPVSAARQLLGDSPIIGLSTHSEQQIRDAIGTEGLDYFCTGPVWATPTKPGRAAVGLDLVRYAAAQVAASSPERPWFAIGGINLTNVREVVDAGAHRIVVVRAVTEAADPAAAARELKDALP